MLNQDYLTDVRVIAFDADDTLWDCQTYFDHVTEQMCDLLCPWADHDTCWQELLRTESKNLPLTGYGCKAYILSVIETAIRVSHAEIGASAVNDLIQSCYGLLNLPADPLPEVEQTLKTLRRRIDDERLPLRMAVFTKGDLLNQRHKLERSGLAPLFDWVEITADKQTADFQRLCERLDIRPEHLLMVGNSFKSDIAPALAVGAASLYIPFHAEWEMEQVETFDHPRCRRLTHFGEVLDCLFPQ
ncbi:MAG: HAD hydrolase-like protein [Bacteroidaceae bacterium]|nr:HAD hydrolase-like protein [Bacteroidaceae bacterium]